MTSQLPSEDQKKETQKKLQHLVGVAFERGIMEAIREARKANDPYMLDAFHDAIVDKLYEELVRRHKLDELK